MEEGLNEKVYVSTIKEQFVPAEYSLLVDWAPVLEKAVKGATLIYLQLQTAVDRWKKSDKFGKSNISMRSLCERCNITRPTLGKILDVLEANKFVIKDSGKTKGEVNSYTILELPVFKEIVVEIPKINYVEADVFSDGLKGKSEDKIKSLGEKDLARWNCNDLLAFFKEYYYIVFNEKYSNRFTVKERVDFKRLIEEYGPEKAKKTVEYAVRQWQELSYLNGYPSPCVIYGFRKSLVPEANRGVISNRGQYTGVEKEVGIW